MIRHTLIVIAALSAAPSSAQVYKCTVNGNTVYSGTPCATDATAITVKPAAGQPDALETYRAQQLAERDKLRVQSIDAERQMQRLQVEMKRDQAVQSVQAEKQRQADKCANVRRDLAHEREWSERFIMEENRARARESARKLEDREFFDCR